MVFEYPVPRLLECGWLSWSTMLVIRCNNIGDSQPLNWLDWFIEVGKLSNSLADICWPLEFSIASRRASRTYAHICVVTSSSKPRSLLSSALLFAISRSCRAMRIHRHTSLCWYIMNGLYSHPHFYPFPQKDHQSVQNHKTTPLA